MPLHVLTMPGGRIKMPNETTAVYVEIGTNSFDTWDQLMLPHFHNAFLVSFEPLLDKWATLLARNTRSRHAGQLGHHHPRGVALPFAVSDRDGFSDFHVSPRDGCSSLRPPQRPNRGNWKSRGFIAKDCARTVQVRRVPCVSLRTVLHDWLGGRPVARVKIDAQGSDLAVMQTAGETNLLQVGEVVMEVLSDSCDGLYAGQPNCSTVCAPRRGIRHAPFRATAATTPTPRRPSERPLSFFDRRAALRRR